VRLLHSAPHFQGCGCGDPDHSFLGGRIEFNDGAQDGWLRANKNDTFSIGYYTQNDLPFVGEAAMNWTVCDRYFAAIMAETQPNRIYQHAAQTDSLVNRTTISLTLPTIWDRLSQANISGRYYRSGSLPTDSVLFLWGTKYNSISYGLNEFFQNCISGTLPAVSFVDPILTSAQPNSVLYDISLGLIGNDTEGNDDHPHSDIRKGEEFLASIYNAVVSSPNWSSTVLVINFDEWGGFFDHVAPPPAPVPPADEAAYAAADIPPDGLRGFRVPCLVVSPWSRRGYVSSELFDHTSVLKLIEDRWGLAPLTVRDANANDLADALDFDHPNFTHPPQIITPSGPWGGPCETLQEVKQPDGSIVISWDATCRKLVIQTTTAIGLPWSDLSVTNSPYVFWPTQEQQHFRFRLVNRDRIQSPKQRRAQTSLIRIQRRIT